MNQENKMLLLESNIKKRTKKKQENITKLLKWKTY